MTFVRHTSLACGLGALLAAVACSDGAGTNAPGSPSSKQNPGVGDGELPGATHNNGSAGPVLGVAPGAAAPTGSGGSTSFSGAAGAPSTPPPSVGAPLPTGAPLIGGTATGDGVSGTSTGSREVGPAGQPGLLTAGVWDDNRNFERFLTFRNEEAQAQVPGLLPVTVSEQQTALAEFQQLAGPKETLDVSFVIDTTGSMGDELSYLQTEFISISERIHARFPNAEQRWSLVVYRDTSDDYVVRWFDFRDAAQDFETYLAAQQADGGGDFPESPEKGLAKMNELAWRTGAANARLAFWVADAPHHTENAGALADAIRASHDLDVHIYPIAASGVDDLTELTMRTAAQVTGGRYLFLTNDSGVGGDHKEPRIPCYFVTHLDDAILRMVDIEMTGEYREPDASEVMRTGGNPKDGACALESGSTVNVF